MRAIITGFVSVAVQSGPAKGASYEGVLRDMSDGGVCVLLDGDCELVRGTEVELAFADAPSLSAWVCHNARAGETSWTLGISFGPVQVETPDHRSLSQARSSVPDRSADTDALIQQGYERNYYARRLPDDDTLWLQVWHEDDAEEAFGIVEDSRSDLEQWVEWATRVHTADDLREFIRYSVQQYCLGRTWQFAIRQHGTIVGGVGLILRSENVGELGYWLGSAYQRQGIVTRCAREVIRFAFETLGLGSVELRCAITNERSRAVAGRLGFVLAATIPHGHWTCRGMVDLLVYGVNRDEPVSTDHTNRDGCMMTGAA